MFFHGSRPLSGEAILCLLLVFIDNVHWSRLYLDIDNIHSSPTFQGDTCMNSHFFKGYMNNQFNVAFEIEQCPIFLHDLNVLFILILKDMLMHASYYSLIWIFTCSFYVMLQLSKRHS